jgi:mannose-1-phosphate guanylyltransferase/mannose-6-phosphate isomerase
LVPTILPVVISGGAGSRLWPLSTPDQPKQFHALAGDQTLIQQTARRLAGAEGLQVLAPLLICNHRHLAVVREQMAQVGCKPSAIVLEPFGRNTAPVAMTAALIAQALHPGALVLLMPSDHVIADPDAFAAAVAGAARGAGDRIVLLGVAPMSPETGFGYIEVGEPLQGPVSTVARFVEKPDLAAAQRYVAGGRHLWNAGVFLFAPEVVTGEMRRLAPQVAQAVEQALQDAQRRDEVIALDPAAFATCPSISFDYAVMEHTDKAAVAALQAGWADIGSWNSLWGEGPRSADGNFVRGDAHLIDTQDCLIWSEGKTVGAVGLRDLIVVQTDAGVLVLPRSRAQDVKTLVEQLQARDRTGGKSS